MVQKTKTKSKTGTASKGTVKTRELVVRKELIVARNSIDRGFVDLAKLLSEAYHKEFHRKWGFSTWEEYISSELEIPYQKCMYYIRIWDRVKDFGLSQKEIDEMGWTKMRAIMPSMTKENATKLIEQAKKLSVRELESSIKKTRRKDKTGTDLPTLTTWTLRMSEAEASVITEAVQTAKKMTGNDNPVTALEMICQDWMLEKGVTPERTPLDAHIKYLENAYGVTLAAREEDDDDTTKSGDVVDVIVDEPDAGDDLLAQLGIE